ncbi:MAG: YtxH domain-containing protein [Nitrospira sp.]|nr:MAG: YtxH domain-containing protein [Nitrospira sp.]
MADERGSSATVLVAFLSGAALGAVAALLLAPQSGRESREQLRGYARRAEDNLRDFAGRAEDNLRDLAGRAGETFDEVVEQGKEYVDAKKSVLREAFEAGRDAMKRERDRIRGEEQA